MKKGFFYGYAIVIILFFLQLLMFGPRASYGVFIKPLTSEFDWSRTLISGAFSLSILVQGFSSIFMGGLNDRLGPRKVLTLCGIFVGAGLMLMFFINSAWQLYLFWAIFGVGMGGLYSPQMSTVARWFVKRRNIMTGVLVTGGGIGGLIAPLLTTSLIYTYNWRDAFLFVGIVVFVLIVFAAQLLKRDPSQTGQLAYGEGNASSGKSPGWVGGISLKEAVHTGRFWIFAFVIFSFGFCMATLLVHVVPFAIDQGNSPSTAAIILAVMNGAVPVGSIAGGLIADKIGSRKIFLISCSLFPLVLLFLVPLTSVWLFCLLVVIIYLGGGGLFVMLSSMTAELLALNFMELFWVL
jgi:MFS family permease